MGLTTALFSGLSGMTANSQAITVTGNNIANVNTTAFKSGRISFETQMAQTLSNGSAPSGALGGTNPSQIGLGTRISQITRNFNTGSINPTGVNTDLAIEGNGFFRLNFDGTTRYSRDGTFQVDNEFNLVNSDGGLVQGYGVDGDFNVVEGVLSNLRVPIGALTLAEATENVRFAGNLNTGGQVATQGGLVQSAALLDAATTSPASGSTQLTDLQDAAGTNLLASGDIITVSGAKRGGASLADHTFEVGATNTSGSDANGAVLDDFLAFLDAVLGIDSDADAAAGITVNASGQIEITSNSGTVNDLDVQRANILINAGSGSTSAPFEFNKLQSADGESVRTTFVVFDSLGTPVTVDMSVVLESTTNNGSQWRVYVQSEDDTDLDRVLSNSMVEFDTNGRVLTSNGPAFTIDRLGTGAQTPLTVSAHFSSPEGQVSALTDTTSQFSSASQDGSGLGTLVDYSVAEDGTIVGVFSNSLLRDLGRVVLAVFTNPRGLVEKGGNLFDVSSNSGEAQLVTPGKGGAGRTIGGALELSNVELSQEFINLITATTGFSAASRVVTTSDRMIQELLATLRP